MPEPALKPLVVYPLPGDPEPASTERADRLEFRDLEPRARVELLLRFALPSAALEEMQEILDGNPTAEERAFCYLRAGQLRERHGNLQAAQACYREAASLEPRDPEVSYFASNNLAYCFNRTGRYREAVDLARRARAIDPGRVNAHKNLGIALEELGRVSEAAESLLAALRIEPEHPVALRRLRVLLASHPAVGRERPDLVREVEEILARGRRDWPKSKPTPDEGLEHSVRELISSIRVEQPLVEGPVQMFGLRWVIGDGPRYLTLDEAMAAKDLEVTEVSEAGSVPRVRVRNLAKQDRVFLMAGEQLVGAKQNRVLNASIVLDARADLRLPVSCVEAGRWAYRGPRFESKGSSSHYALRHMMAKKAHFYYRERGAPESDQGEVWNEVSRKLAELKTESPSGALDAVYEKHERRLEEAFQTLQPEADWCGVAFCFGGRIVAVDLFDRPATLHKLWPKLKRSYALDVLERRGDGEVSKDRFEGWLRDAARALMDVFPSTGLGVDCRLESNRHVGSMLVVDGRPVHLEMFYEDEM